MTEEACYLKHLCPGHYFCVVDKRLDFSTSQIFVHGGKILRDNEKFFIVSYPLNETAFNWDYPEEFEEKTIVKQVSLPNIF